MNAAAIQQYLDFAYIVAVVLFVLAIKWLGSPVSARRGVLAGEPSHLIASTNNTTATM